MYLFICTRHREFGISTFCAFCDYLTRCKVHDFGKKMIFYEIFQVGACPNLKDSSLYDRFIIHMYKARSIRFLWLFCAICDSLMSCTIHFFGKRWFFMKYFKLVHASTWKIPHFMIGFLFMCTRLEAIGNSQSFALSATPLCCTRYILCEKDDFSWNISSWCMPQLERFLIIWKLFYSYVQGKKHSASLNFFLYLGLSYALYCTFLGKKMIFFHEIFQVGACPNLKDSSLYDRFSIHMYKAWSVRFISLFCAICYSLMPCTVHFFLEKYDLLMKYFKLVHALTWKIP